MPKVKNTFVQNNRPLSDSPQFQITEVLCLVHVEFIRR